MAANNDSSAFELGDQGADVDNDSGKKDKDSQGRGLSSEAQRLARTDYSKITHILDIPLKVSVEIGQTKLLTNEILQFGPGYVLELNKLAGEAMEILLNDKLIALGEVVVVNEKYGVRLTDVISSLNPSQQAS